MGAGPVRQSHSGTSAAGARFARLSHLRELRECEKVAAVCYRMSEQGIEFLLVRTRGGRWTFPKGGTEPGLTHAQAAALEAFEEAGVHGRIEEATFTRYFYAERSRTTPMTVHAHLCEVTRLARPQEAKRDRTWFSAEKAKRRLREDRPTKEGTEMARVVDRAVQRIQRFRFAASPATPEGRQDNLRKVHFEAANPPGGMVEVSLARYLRRQRREVGTATIEWAVNAFLGKMFRAGAAQKLPAVLADVPRLTNGSSAAANKPQKVTAIDHAREIAETKSASRKNGKEVVGTSQG